MLVMAPLVFLINGIVKNIAFLDPPKNSAAEALKALKRNGVDVKILTGDNEIITRKICRY
jgi:P-type Mg2+ transporter